MRLSFFYTCSYSALHAECDETCRYIFLRVLRSILYAMVSLQVHDIDGVSVRKPDPDLQVAEPLCVCEIIALCCLMILVVLSMRSKFEDDA